MCENIEITVNVELRTQNCYIKDRNLRIFECATSNYVRNTQYKITEFREYKRNDLWI
jgi:AAA15 family ATPase/GTPase